MEKKQEEVSYVEHQRHALLKRCRYASRRVLKSLDSTETIDSALILEGSYEIAEKDCKEKT